MSRHSSLTRTNWHRPRIWRGVILTLATIFFLGPIAAATKFALELGKGMAR